MPRLSGRGFGTPSGARGEALKTPARDLIQNVRGRRRNLQPMLVALKAGSVERRYPVIRDHRSVQAVNRWLTAVDEIHRTSREVVDLLPEGMEGRKVVGEIAAFARMAGNIVRLTVGEPAFEKQGSGARKG